MKHMTKEEEVKAIELYEKLIKAKEELKNARDELSSHLQSICPRVATIKVYGRNSTNVETQHNRVIVYTDGTVERSMQRSVALSCGGKIPESDDEVLKQAREMREDKAELKKAAEILHYIMSFSPDSE